MKELKMPVSIHNDEFDIEIMPYLTAQNIIDIGETMLTYDNITEQKIVLGINLLKECTNVEDEVIETLDVDLMFASGLFGEVCKNVLNVSEVWSYVNHKSDMNIAIANFFNNTMAKSMEDLLKLLEKFEKKMPKGAKWNEMVKQFPESLKQAIDTMKESGNAEIIANAVKLSTVQSDDKQ